MTQAAHNIKATLYKDTHTAKQYTSLTDVWHLQRTAEKVDYAIILRAYAEAVACQYQKRLVQKGIGQCR